MAKAWSSQEAPKTTEYYQERRPQRPTAERCSIASTHRQLFRAIEPSFTAAPKSNIKDLPSMIANPGEIRGQIFFCLGRLQAPQSSLGPQTHPPEQSRPTDREYPPARITNPAELEAGHGGSPAFLVTINSPDRKNRPSRSPPSRRSMTIPSRPDSPGPSMPVD